MVKNTFAQYFEDVRNATVKYGPKVAVMIQIGSFYEIYASPSCEGTEQILLEIKPLLNMRIGRKKKPVGMNLSFLGFPLAGYEVNKNILVEAGFYVLRYDQDGTGPSNEGKRVPRYLGMVDSPGTHIESNNLSNNLLVMYIDYHETTRTKTCSIGLSSIDLRTGKCSLYETHSQPNNYNTTFENAYRYITSTQPIEIRIYSNVDDINQRKIHTQLDLDKYLTVWQLIKSQYKKMLNVDFQDEFLSKLKLDPIRDELLIQKHAISSYIYLLAYVNEFHSHVLKKLKYPDVENEESLILANNAIKQLRIIPPPGEKGVSSLFNVMDKTTTIMGKRTLKYNLLHPFLSKSQIELRHKNIDEVRGHVDALVDNLKLISDMDKWYRMIVLTRITPLEFVERIYTSHRAIKKIIKYIKSNKLDLKYPEIGNISSYTDILDLEKIMIGVPYFKKGYNDDIDEYTKIQTKANGVFEKHKKDLIEILPKARAGTELVKMDYNSTVGYFLHTTVAKSKLLKSNKDAKDMNLKFKTFKSKVKLFNTKLNKASESKEKCDKELIPLMAKEFYSVIKKWYSKNEDDLNKLNDFVCELDMACCLCKISTLYKYTCPVIVESDKSYVNAKKLRNPYIERIIDEKFIYNDVDADIDGLLLYGPNMAGKSTYMRGLGLSIIMAQIGSYVPAKSYEISPFNTLITRIMGEDDERRGQSSFMVEMSEIRIMIKNSDEKTIALGDEICRGTGHLDAISLVSATIQHMSSVGAKFIFTTHLHDLKYRDEITEIKNLKLKHLGVESISDELLFTRKIKDGPGPETYGIEIAKSLGLGETFLANALAIRTELCDNAIVSTKSSKYNKSVHLTDCKKCGKRQTLQTHHIQEQSEADENGYIEYMHKNIASNLVVLCEKCHAKETKKRYK